MMKIVTDTNQNDRRFPPERLAAKPIQVGRAFKDSRTALSLPPRKKKKERKTVPEILGGFCIPYVLWGGPRPLKRKRDIRGTGLERLITLKIVANVPNVYCVWSSEILVLFQKPTLPLRLDVLVGDKRRDFYFHEVLFQARKPARQSTSR